jgi:hypothetical protein
MKISFHLLELRNYWLKYYYKDNIGIIIKNWAWPILSQPKMAEGREGRPSYLSIFQRRKEGLSYNNNIHINFYD